MLFDHIQVLERVYVGYKPAEVHWHWQAARKFKEILE
jgi:hypothetical protein